MKQFEMKWNRMNAIVSTTPCFGWLYMKARANNRGFINNEISALYTQVIIVVTQLRVLSSVFQN
jgi:hypothetical protein